MNIAAFGSTVEQTEILLNMEYYKTLHDIQYSKSLMKNEDKNVLSKSGLMNGSKILQTVSVDSCK